MFYVHSLTIAVFMLFILSISIVDANNNNNNNNKKSPFHPQEKEKFPLFVTWKKRHSNGEYRLRGCIGTFSPRELHVGLKEYAHISAFKDSRFSPVSSHELPSLRCDVSLLTNFEPASHSRDWSVGVHGITIDFNCPRTARSYSATYLPEVAEEQGWDVDTTLIELCAKAGYRGKVDEALIKSIKVTRYQSSKASLTYDEYKKLITQ